MKFSSAVQQQSVRGKGRQSTTRGWSIRERVSVPWPTLQLSQQTRPLHAAPTLLYAFNWLISIYSDKDWTARSPDTDMAIWVSYANDFHTNYVKTMSTNRICLPLQGCPSATGILAHQSGKSARLLNIKLSRPTWYSALEHPLSAGINFQRSRIVNMFLHIIKQCFTDSNMTTTWQMLLKMLANLAAVQFSQYRTL